MPVLPTRYALARCRHILLAAALLSAGPLAGAQTPPSPDAPPRPARNWNEPIGPTVADKPSAHYRFETLRFDSEDGQRHYRVYLGVPKRAAPAGGYPVIYMLDGNAVMATLNAQDLAALDAEGPPVLVGIGYETPGRHDVVARALDYTPPVIRDGQRVAEIEERGRRGGGADRFQALIERQIRPAVQARAPIDQNRQTLWGHSYGGLFTLYALFTHPERFQRYVAGDPSVGWQDSALLAHAAGFHASAAPGVAVRVMVGGARRPGASGAASIPTIPGVPAGRESTYELVQRLAGEGMDITFQNFPDLSHGALFATSLRPALELAVRP
ncbi:alpha/beta hydrolase [Verticiella sediminum]|uniref:Alpha/beta hydrolase n=1 Tax=Verticiella sediminum TaxID=1247510 RepID=A0A556ABZ8_9BURK|nr:alpha/beta hydrolase-fold protein [Verticiella sediminum]TSH90408.1 alpha/beta hydrolase [Verticiella sediminum]